MKKIKLFTYAFLALWLISVSHYIQAEETLHVYKSPTCGCCSKWINHLDEHGYQTSFSDEDDMSALKDTLGVPMRYRSCHTGSIKHAKGKYFFEGHIPARTIQRFLSKPPKNAIGLSVPGMPVGSPGMEVGNKTMAYKIFVIYADGKVQVYENIPG